MRGRERQILWEASDLKERQSTVLSTHERAKSRPSLCADLMNTKEAGECAGAGGRAGGVGLCAAEEHGMPSLHARVTSRSRGAQS